MLEMLFSYPYYLLEPAPMPSAHYHRRRLRRMGTEPERQRMAVTSPSGGDGGWRRRMGAEPERW
uniref:Uncharacterized protein n=1 Tax=Oryza glumipatula TaxID=40148 RepID=A0A0D9YZR9_9ORYZ